MVAGGAVQKQSMLLHHINVLEEHETVEDIIETHISKIYNTIFKVIQVRGGRECKKMQPRITMLTRET